MKIIDKINQELKNDNVFYSFEYFPPKTKSGQSNLYLKLNKMSNLIPLFIDITWGAGGSTSDLTLDICKNTQNVFCLETQMHLTCTNINEEIIKKTLDSAKENNIMNILALRGDPPENTEEWKATDSNFQYSKDLVQYIKKNYNDYFGICVAGYPEGHPDNNYQDDLKYLKEKVDCGADYIITQLFYDVDIFLKFYKDCRNIGITCPILPGILPIVGYNNFKRMTSFCKVSVPEHVNKELEKIKDDDSKVAQFGIKLAVEMCEKLISNGIKGIHLYTLNREDSIHCILEKLNLLQNIQIKRQLPWNAKLNSNESVRPIFWANTLHYYNQRTLDWNQFPNGRWGNSNDAQYGEIEDYNLFGISLCSNTLKKKYWGNVNTIEDIQNVFIKFIKEEIKIIPWCSQVANETELIREKLININNKGYLTINSQPKFNGLPSEHKFGWGGPNGYLYQKEYLEFFTTEDKFKNILNSKDFDKKYQYCAVNINNNIYTNCKDSTIALTWGIFPQKEIIQPTIVDYQSFLIWKNDCFKLWIKEWASIYDTDSSEYQFIKSIHDTYYLVYVISNDYINGNIFSLF